MVTITIAIVTENKAAKVTIGIAQLERLKRNVTLQPTSSFGFDGHKSKTSMNGSKARTRGSRASPGGAGQSPDTNPRGGVEVDYLTRTEAKPIPSSSRVLGLVGPSLTLTD